MLSFPKSTVTAVLGTLLVIGCTGIPYNPATNTDSTKPSIGLRVEGQSPGSVYLPNPPTTDAQCFPKKTDFCPDIRVVPVDVGEQNFSPVISVQIHEKGEVSILATAQDSESGIRSIKLTCQRDVYYNWDSANQTEANAHLTPVVSEKTNQINSGRVPETGVVQMILNMNGQMAFANAAGSTTRGHRVSIKCSAEASNFIGLGVKSSPIVVWAQDHAIQP